MEQKYVLGIVAVAMLVVLSVSAVSAFGNGFIHLGLSDEEKALLQEEKDAIKTSIEEGDYFSWKELMEERIQRMQDSITEESFNELVEKHKNMIEFREAVENLKDSGEFSEEALQELRKEYGIENGLGKMNGKHFDKERSFDLEKRSLRE